MKAVRFRLLPCCLCALAGSTAALAQVKLEGGFPAPANMTFAEAPVPAGYRQVPMTEALAFVYETPNLGENGTAGTFFQNGGASLCFDVIQFPAFPPEQGVPNPLPVSQIGFPMATTALTPVTFDALITFFSTFDLEATAAPFYSNELGHVRFNGIQLPAQQPGRIGFFWFNNLGIVDDLGNAATINLPRDQQFGYELRYLNPGTNDLFPGNTGLQGWCRGGPLTPNTGTSIPHRYFDANFDGVLNPDIAGVPLERSGGPGNARDVYLKLVADIPIQVTFPFTPLGTLDCATSTTLTHTFAVAPGTVTWVQVVLPGTGATVAADSFLDITADNTTSLVDGAMGLYNSDGNRMSSDDDDGEGLNPQLSFGHGRRAGLGDAVQLDGRDGDAPAGTYFLAVTGFGATFGASGFAVNAANTVDFGDLPVTFTHNLGATNCALPTPIAPAVVADLGILPRGVTSVNFQPDFRSVAWWKFTIDYTVTAADADKFLDIDTVGSENGDAADTGLALYDALGVSVGNPAFDNNNGPGLNAQMSFRNGTSVPGVGDGLPYEGQNGGEVPAGEYFIAAFLVPATIVADGWQTRSTSGSSSIIQVNLRTPADCAADFNNDGNVDPDDLADFITCFFLDIQFPGFCADADFNGDTFRDPDDLADFITTFFLAVGGIGC
jgi:hypothetical protein